VAMMGRQVPWSKLRGLRAHREDAGGDPVVVRSCLLGQGVTILGLADWAEAELFVVPCVKKGSLRQRVLWRAVLSGCWLLSVGAAQGGQGIFVKYQAALQKDRQHIGAGERARGNRIGSKP